MSAEVIKGMFGQMGQTAQGPMSTMPPVMRRGAVGPLVGDLQRRLNAIGYKLTVDNQFGPKTEAAVKGFQLAAGVPQTGIVDNATWTELFRRTAAAIAIDPALVADVPSVPSSANPFIASVQQTPIVKFFLEAPLWQKALMAGGALALGYLLVSWLTQGSALRGYERALNAEPKCPRNAPPREVPEDAKIVEAA